MKKDKINIIDVLFSWLLLAGFFATIIISAVQIRNLKISVMELEAENTQLLKDLDEVEDDFELLKERIEQLEELYDKEQRPSFEDYQYGIAKVVSRLNYDDYYSYVVEIKGILLTVYSQELFSVDEEVLIIEYSEGKLILIDLS